MVRHTPLHPADQTHKAGLVLLDYQDQGFVALDQSSIDPPGVEVAPGFAARHPNPSTASFGLADSSHVFAAEVAFQTALRLLPQGVVEPRQHDDDLVAGV